MSEPNSPSSTGDCVYRFISDPGHKENLSGRVRAACLTCRRKKIKCSGEFNCRTCREKGLVCEGLPERKRPLRDTGTSYRLDSTASGIDRKRKVSPSKKSELRRPSATLRTTDSSDSRDSGYSSNHGEASNGAAPAESGSEQTRTATASLSSAKPKRESRQAGLRIDTWHLNDQHTTQTAQPGYNLTNPDSHPSVSSHAQSGSAVLSPSPLNWLQPQQFTDGWADHFKDDGQYLMSAQALENEADCLRVMANHQYTSDLPDSLTRRQTVLFPLESPPAFGPRYDMLDNQHGIFDDMALLLANRTPRTGMTPSLTEFSSWWEINGVGDLATVFGNNTGISDPVSGSHTGQPPSYEEAHVMHSDQNVSGQLTSTDTDHPTQYLPN